MNILKSCMCLEGRPNTLGMMSRCVLIHISLPTPARPASPACLEPGLLVLWLDKGLVNCSWRAAVHNESAEMDGLLSIPLREWSISCQLAQAHSQRKEPRVVAT